jgi:hypothetical protein
MRVRAAPRCGVALAASQVIARARVAIGLIEVAIARPLDDVDRQRGEARRLELGMRDMERAPSR